MSREFIDFLRKMPVYRCFDGEVISCEEQVVKPEPEIYRRLLDRYSLDPAETLFIDDRPVNLEPPVHSVFRLFCSVTAKRSGAAMSCGKCCCETGAPGSEPKS